MTLGQLKRGNEIQLRVCRMNDNLSLLKGIDRRSKKYAIYLPTKEEAIILDELPEEVLSAAIDVLITGFEREIAKATEEFTKL